ncbi:MAG: twin-arginine translocation signal domain-containing protein, partial [Deltaproteobacteria bacterium]|nr:twin-arginine translocation signal domain-containing protein [Deltaproteobacteria bacterium]
MNSKISRRSFLKGTMATAC